jgi:deoxyribonuclease-4
MSIAGGHHNAARAAQAAGMKTVQVFTKASHQWSARPLTDSDVRAFRDALAEGGLVDPVAHVSYLINLASPDSQLWSRSIDSLTLELERAEALGIEPVVAHPGSHLGSGEDAGLTRIAQALDQVHRRLPGLRARVTLESTAGQGSSLGYRLEHLATILDRVLAPERLAICLDTCHLFAAGYSWSDTASYNLLIDEVDRHVGIARVRVWHLNDSARECGSRVDRHAGIGCGRIGLEPFRALVNDRRFARLPMILETPKGTDSHGVDLDVVNRLALERLIAGRPAAAPRRRRSARDG